MGPSILCDRRGSSLSVNREIRVVDLDVDIYRLATSRTASVLPTA